MSNRFPNEAILQIRGLVEELQGALQRLQTEAPPSKSVRPGLRPMRGGGGTGNNPLKSLTGI